MVQSNDKKYRTAQGRTERGIWTKQILSLLLPSCNLPLLPSFFRPSPTTGPTIRAQIHQKRQATFRWRLAASEDNFWLNLWFLSSRSLASPLSPLALSCAKFRRERARSFHLPWLTLCPINQNELKISPSVCVSVFNPSKGLPSFLPFSLFTFLYSRHFSFISCLSLVQTET